MTAFPPRSAPLHLGALGFAASAALVVLFVLCWIVAAVIPSLGASHGWIALFTTAPVSSVRALVEGVVWSIVFAWIIALVIVPIYNRIAGD